ncbi:MAG: hypothetical protein ACR2LX_12205 [Jatrophihabitans sp.]
MWIVVLVVVLMLAGAAFSDFHDRRKGRTVRTSGELVDIKRERRMNLRSTPMHGIPPAPDWQRPLTDKLKDKNRGGV